MSTGPRVHAYESLDDDDLQRCYAYPPGPWTRLNLISSADGGAVDAAGLSGGLGTDTDRRLFALQRNLADVVLVGAGTARAEGYRPVWADEVDVDLRRRLRLAPTPPLAVVSASLDLPDALLDVPDGGARTIVLTPASSPVERRDALAERAEVVVCGDESLDLAAAGRSLAERGLQRVLAEGGPALARELVAAGVLDELCLTLRGRLVGGDGPRPLAGPVLDPPVDLDLGHLLVDGSDLYLRWTLRR